MSDYGKLTDEQLVERFNKGDTLAQDFLLKKYKNMVIACKKSYYLAGAGDEDIIQEGMIGLFKAIRDYSPQKNSTFKSFAKLCITRQIITAVKSATRKKHLPMANYISLNSSSTDDGTGQTILEALITGTNSDPQIMVLQKEDNAQMSERINTCLSGFEKKVLELYLKGLTYDEIAKSIDKTPKSIDNALQRVKKKLGGNKKII
ncbi:MAG: RNA polymerase sporulation sigma factor SigH [Clostridia bacterium]|nr:RNA polymerase sporulation sigma factor SigH [Clostridia bacterium]